MPDPHTNYPLSLAREIDALRPGFDISQLGDEVMQPVSGQGLVAFRLGLALSEQASIENSQSSSETYPVFEERLRARREYQIGLQFAQFLVNKETSK